MNSRPRDVSFATLTSLLAVAAVLLTSANLRAPVSSFPPIADRAAEELGASHTFIGVVGMAPTAMFAVAAVLSGPLSRRMSFRSIVILAMLLATAGFGARTLAAGPILFLVGTMIGLVGVGITNTLLPAVVKDYFPFRITVMSIAYMMVGQLSMATASAVSVPLADYAGWRAAIAVWIVPSMLAVVAWVALIVRVTPPHSRRHLFHVPHLNFHGPAGTDNRKRYSHIWKHPVSWGIVAMFASTSTMSYCFITWAPKIITSSGGSEELGGMVGAVFALVGVGSSIIAPWFTQRFASGARWVAVMSGLCMYSGLLLVLQAPMHMPMLWISLVSAGCTTFQLALILVATRTQAAGAAAELSSRAQGIGYSIACIGPFSFGLLHDMTGDWTIGLSALLVVNTILLCAGWLASRNVLVDCPPPARKYG